MQESTTESHPGSPSAPEAPFSESFPSKNLPDKGTSGSELLSPEIRRKERYRLEVDFLREKIGPLEEVRAQLGLSQRKMSELLLVDPASWSRWVKKGAAPGYIYKSLQWFLALRERHPEVATFAWLQTQSDEKNSHYLEHEIQQLKAQIQDLQNLSQASGRGRFNLNHSGKWALLFALGVGVGWAMSYGF